MHGGGGSRHAPTSPPSRDVRGAGFPSRGGFPCLTPFRPGARRGPHTGLFAEQQREHIIRQPLDRRHAWHRPWRGCRVHLGRACPLWHVSLCLGWDHTTKGSAVRGRSDTPQPTAVFCGETRGGRGGSVTLQASRGGGFSCVRQRPWCWPGMRGGLVAVSVKLHSAAAVPGVAWNGAAWCGAGGGGVRDGGRQHA